MPNPAIVAQAAAVAAPIVEDVYKKARSEAAKAVKIAVKALKCKLYPCRCEVQKRSAAYLATYATVVKEAKAAADGGVGGPARLQRMTRARSGATSSPGNSGTLARRSSPAWPTARSSTTEATAPGTSLCLTPGAQPSARIPLAGDPGARWASLRPSRRALPPPACLRLY